MGKSHVKTPTVPDFAEWDFSSVTLEQLNYALVWEFSRESTKVRTRILKWLDGEKFDGKTVREWRIADSLVKPEEYDPETLRNLPSILTTGIYQKQQARMARAEKMAIPLRVPHFAGNREPAKNHLDPHIILWELLNMFGKEFPKPWVSFAGGRWNNFYKWFHAYPIKLEPANSLLIQQSHCADCGKNPIENSWRISAERESQIARSWLLEVDFANTTKAMFLKEMERFWKQTIQNLKLSRRRQKKLEGNAGKPPWVELKRLAALRLRKHLSIEDSRRAAKSRNDELAKRGQHPSNRKDSFSFPVYANTKWPENVRQASQQIVHFERKILPSFT